MKQRASLFLNKQEGGQKAGGRGGEHQFEDCSSQAGPRGKIFSMNIPYEFVTLTIGTGTGIYLPMAYGL